MDLLPHLLAGAAEAALDAGDREVAVSRITAALQATDLSADPLARLSAERIAGRIRHADAEHAEARAHFERALEIAAAVDSPMETGRVAFDYAQVLEEQGDSAQALIRYRQAYRARQAAGVS